MTDGAWTSAARIENRVSEDIAAGGGGRGEGEAEEAGEPRQRDA